MAYVDGFLVPVKKERLDDYRSMATMARDIWKEAGAIDYVECLPDDVQVGMAVKVGWEPLRDGRNLPVFEPA